MNRGERGAEFMRHIGDKIPLDALQPLGWHHIVQDGHGAAGGSAGQRNGMNIEGAHLRRGQVQPLAHRYTRIQDLLHDLVQGRIADDLN